MLDVERTSFMERRPPDRSDTALVDRLRRGDQRALADVYDVYAGMVHGLALRVLRDRRAAEDVTQEVFVALWQDPHRFDADRGTLRGFLATLAHRRAVDAVRRDEARRARELRAAHAPAPGPDPAETVIDLSDSERVRVLVAGLPTAQRRALELAYFAGRTYRQVAEELGIPEGTAKSRLRLALQAISEKLRGELSERWA
jgi:RNA polymerase sigma-70 factor (ECF subfamily)